MVETLVFEAPTPLPEHSEREFSFPDAANDSGIELQEEWVYLSSIKSNTIAIELLIEIETGKYCRNCKPYSIEGESIQPVKTAWTGLGESLPKSVQLQFQ